MEEARRAEDGDRDELEEFLDDVRSRLSATPLGRDEGLVLGSWRLGADVYVLALGGEMDMGNAAALGKAVRELSPRDGACVIVELSALSFADSSALRELTRLARELRGDGGLLVLAAPGLHVARVFELTNIQGVVPVAESLEAALELASELHAGSGAARMLNGVRKAANEDAFRGVNERLEVRALESEARRERFEIVCECDREECTARIGVDFADYEAVRTSPRAFIVLPGHSDVSCERVVASAEGYEVVEKVGEAGIVAELSDARREGARQE